ncbi:MAG: bifunctional phosphopantothenoylcysteine decarboxylase/phosphopantothenate--cysteine ligase CoaBC [Bacteroidia bacterium]|nr:bifunctional phosphopantothenoylcysteine decarboxylase/phosphopantothenate--cysteine ligase CoaBC [Bacteroidia bacterium]
MLEGKKILIGISGSIAAYKMAALTRLFVKAGADVKVIMTDSAQQFITPLTLATLSKNPVYSSFIKGDSGEWVNHVELGLWADYFIIAPLSASTLSKMASGNSDNLLLATYLSARCRVVVAPAMDLDMFAHPSTQKNLELIQSYGNIVIKPNHGELASGLVGEGRMAEPEEIIEFVSNLTLETQELHGKTVLVTAGPTYEAIDPVRFIGNHSSGKMGFALARICALKGAKVILVSGPSNEQISHPNITFLSVQSAHEMHQTVVSHFAKADITIMSAAVADYTPAQVSAQKIKKQDSDLKIDLVRTKDILKELGQLKKENQLLIGFALETENEQENAHKKLLTKNLDFIVLNSLRNEKAGFGFPTNQIQIIDRDGKINNYELKLKEEVAIDIVNKIIEKLHA